VNLPLHHQLVNIDRPLTRYGRAMRARRRADEIVYAEIARRRAAHASAGCDVLDLLLDAGGPASAAVDPECPAQQDPLGDTEGARGDGALSDTELRDQVVSLVAAGYDTTSAAVGWAVHELVTRPDVWRRVATEVADAVGSDPITPEVLPADAGSLRPRHRAPGHRGFDGHPPRPAARGGTRRPVDSGFEVVYSRAAKASTT
jgi:cytochrome P450